MATVSVIMAAYNGAAFLPETLVSLQAQTMTDWELIAVDDCSTDGTAAMLEGWGDERIRVIRAPANGGPVVARNLAFAAARGRYAAGLDQDDLCLPERFAKQVAFLDAHPETVLVSTAARLLENGRLSPGGWPRQLTPGLIDWLMLVQNPFAWSSVMFRTDAARRLDPFERPEMRYVEDFDFYHRIRALGELAQIDEELLLYRIHDGGASNVFNDTMCANAAKLLSRHAPDIAPLLVAHVMSRRPVPDIATLGRLFAGIARLNEAFAPGRDTETLDRVHREIATLWHRLCRAGVRSGRIALHRAMADRPSGASIEPAALADLVVSQAIGGIRAIRRAVAG
ncbi:glycosyltransferase [Sphingomonas sp. HF-S3]|uniref:Glycosyltransferase n=1 Tax=Sphingomonas rustica TaxID=3103142 RepID=A0ABV0BGI2_9SPHN